MENKAKNRYLSPNQKAWKRFKRNKPALFGIGVIILAFFIAVFAYGIAPDPTPSANDQILEIATKPPGFKQKMLLLRKNRVEKNKNIISALASGKESEFRKIPIIDAQFAGDKLLVKPYTGLDSESELDTFLLADIVYPLKAETSPLYDGDQVELETIEGKKLKLKVLGLKETIQANQIVEKRYLLGTDKFGRDNLSRLILGVRISLSVGIMAVLISLFIGITLGSIAGYFRGWVDDLIMWIINVFWSIPLLLLVFALILVMGREFWQIYLAVGLTMWVEVARIVRGQILSIREKEYVEAAQGLGFGHFRTITRHILPNTVGPVVVITAANFASAIIIEAGLSFLGIGVQPPSPSWGSMLNEYYGYIGTSKAFLALVPGLAILVLVLAFNLVGNGLRDALDVKTKSTQ